MSRLESPFESAVDSNRSRYAFSVLFHLRQLTDLGRHRCQLRLGHQVSQLLPKQSRPRVPEPRLDFRMAFKRLHRIVCPLGKYFFDELENIYRVYMRILNSVVILVIEVSLVFVVNCFFNQNEDRYFPAAAALYSCRVTLSYAL